MNNIIILAFTTMIYLERISLDLEREGCKNHTVKIHANKDTRRTMH